MLTLSHKTKSVVYSLALEGGIPLKVEGTFRFKYSNTLVFLGDDKKSFLKIVINGASPPRIEVITIFDDKVIDSTGDKTTGTLVVQCVNKNETLFLVNQVNNNVKIRSIHLETITLYCLHGDLLFFKDFDGNNCKIFNLTEERKG